MKMGKVRFIIEYAVDLDKPEQIEVAKDFVAEDVSAAVTYNEVESYMEVIEDSSVTEADIHEGIIELTTDEDDDNE